MIPMGIGRFLSWYMRIKSSQYLTFNTVGEIIPPVAPADPTHLYIHIPFCVQLCPYCSFHRVRFSEPEGHIYFQALRKELIMYSERGFKFSGVYIGGGTPTIDMQELLDTVSLIQKLFSPREISVETNPDRLDKGILTSLADYGVKRVSVGIQSFQDKILKSVGRYDKYGSGSILIDKLVSAKGCVETLNLDMIYNFPIQDRAMLESDLRIISNISPDQITFYPLMISHATRKNMESIMGPANFRNEKMFYRMITSHLAQSYEASSAWCFSKKGSSMIDEYIVQSKEYVGIGSGAFGLVNGTIYANTFSLKDYIQSLDNNKFPLYAKKDFSGKEMARYTFLMDLFGLKMDRRLFRERFGSDVLYMLTLDCLFFFLIGGLHIDSHFLKLTRTGQYYWIVMMREFFTGVDNFRDFSRTAVGIDI